MGTRRGGTVSDDRLRELYAAGVAGRAARAQGEHSGPEALAALARREGSEAARLATLDHVMSCAECRRDFDLLRTVERAGVESGVAGHRKTQRSWFIPAALAASLLFAVGIGRQLLRPGDTATTRGDAGGSAIMLVQPGADVPAGQPLVFAWRPVPGAARYELELLDAGGNVAASATTSDTSASPEPARELPPGDYRWWVRATTSDARSLRSELRPLRLTPK
jgi:hypothetical protein